MKNFLIWLGCLYGAFAFSQNSLSGTLTDSNNKPIEYIIVEIPALQKGVVTDSVGKYRISNIPVGSYKVLFYAIGYDSQRSEITFDAGEKDLNLNIELKQRVIEIDEVIVSTPFHQLQNENIVKVNKVGLQSLEQQAAVSLSQGIDQIPGVTILSTGVGIGKPIIRGLSGNRVVVYAQGIRLENQQFGDEHGLGLSAAGLESVEVIKGPASLLYGSDALGGVLYFNPEKFGKKPLEVNLSSRYFGNTKGTATSAGAKMSNENLRFLARFSVQSHQDYLDGMGQSVFNTRFKTSDFKTGINYQNGTSNTSLRFNLNNAVLGIPEAGGIASSSRGKEFPYQEIITRTLSLEQRNHIGTLRLNTTFGYIINDRKEFEEELPSAALDMKLSTFTYDSKLYLPKNKALETVIGIQGLSQKNKNFGLESLIPNATISDFGIYAMTHYHGQKSDWQVGIRWDNRNLNSVSFEQDEVSIDGVSKNFQSFNASLGSKVILSEALILRTNFASGFRAPNLAELTSYGVHEGSNRFEIGSAALKPEQNVQTDLSLEGSYDHFRFTLDGFYNSFNNFIYLRPTGAQIEEENVYAYDQTKAKLYGGEISVHWHPHPLDWVHLESSFEFVIGKQSDGEPLPLIPANAFNNIIKFQLKDLSLFSNSAGFVGVNTVFKKSKVSAFETSSPGYALVNLGLNSTITLKKSSLSISIAVQNLMNRSYTAHLSRLKADGLFNIGRTMSLGVTWNW
ncbi:MAG: TonB-dependent receptor [Flavobacteriales bacterium]|tara:strand:+ start:559 stop:2763 length:2205 start_codon:yes stop_codon:yes gene_type:complete